MSIDKECDYDVAVYEPSTRRTLKTIRKRARNSYRAKVEVMQDLSSVERAAAQNLDLVLLVSYADDATRNA